MSAQQFKFLLVDDFEIVRVMVKNVLSAMGYTDIEQAQDGRQAIAKLEEARANGRPFDLVFCDWNMPEVTGIEVLEFCRSRDAYRALPFVMVTAEADQVSVMTALKAGATDYLVKPIAPEVLTKKVNRILDKSKGVA